MSSECCQNDDCARRALQKKIQAVLRCADSCVRTACYRMHACVFVHSACCPCHIMHSSCNSNGLHVRACFLVIRAVILRPLPIVTCAAMVQIAMLVIIEETTANWANEVNDSAAIETEHHTMKAAMQRIIAHTHATASV